MEQEREKDSQRYTSGKLISNIRSRERAQLFFLFGGYQLAGSLPYIEEGLVLFLESRAPDFRRTTSSSSSSYSFSSKSLDSAQDAVKLKFFA